MDSPTSVDVVVLTPGRGVALQAVWRDYFTWEVRGTVVNNILVPVLVMHKPRDQTGVNLMA